MHRPGISEVDASGQSARARPGVEQQRRSPCETTVAVEAAACLLMLGTHASSKRRTRGAPHESETHRSPRRTDEFAQTHPSGGPHADDRFAVRPAHARHCNGDKGVTRIRSTDSKRALSLTLVRSRACKASASSRRCRATSSPKSMWSVLPATAVRLPARCRRPRPVACDRLAPHSRRRTSQGPALGGLRFPEFKRNRSNKNVQSDWLPTS